ncbi:hypothetical protein N7504_006279 [Penicillium tannophilum]|nr:hypothetical protein N7504_006279 [Penicillium tannophilum]
MHIRLLYKVTAIYYDKPRDEKFTINTRVYSIFDTTIPISLRKERLWRQKYLKSPNKEYTLDQDTD